MDVANIALAVSIIILAPIVAALVYLVWRGAMVLLATAAGHGRVGLAAYVAAWVLLFPVMIVAGTVVGGAIVIGERTSRKNEMELQAAKDQENQNRMRPDASAETGLYDEELSDYEKRRGY